MYNEYLCYTLSFSKESLKFSKTEMVLSFKSQQLLTINFIMQIMQIDL